MHSWAHRGGTWNFRRRRRRGSRGWWRWPGSDLVDLFLEPILRLLKRLLLFHFGQLIPELLVNRLNVHNLGHREIGQIFEFSERSFPVQAEVNEPLTRASFALNDVRWDLGPKAETMANRAAHPPVKMQTDSQRAATI